MNGIAFVFGAVLMYVGVIMAGNKRLGGWGPIVGLFIASFGAAFWKSIGSW